MRRRKPARPGTSVQSRRRAAALGLLLALSAPGLLTFAGGACANPVFVAGTGCADVDGGCAPACTGAQYCNALSSFVVLNGQQPGPVCSDDHEWAQWPMPNDPEDPDGGLPYPQSYTAMDGVVTDNVTKLRWQQMVDPGSFTWADAATYCADMGEGWRLPTVIELISIVDYTQQPGTAMLNPIFLPAAPGSLPGGPEMEAWSSTPLAASAHFAAWVVLFSDGLVKTDVVSNASGVRCVR